MFAARWTPTARAEYDQLKQAAQRAQAGRKRSEKRKSSKQEGLFKQVHKAIGLLLNDPRHPGLQTHAYDSLDHPYDRAQKVFEACAQSDTPGAYRIFWCYGPGRKEITIIAITPHP
jgi:hypothetical protein